MYMNHYKYKGGQELLARINCTHECSRQPQDSPTAEWIRDMGEAGGEISQFSLKGFKYSKYLKYEHL